METKAHWENVYTTKAEDAVSWYTPTATVSMELVRQASPDGRGRVIDVGGGTSVLVDKLLDAGFKNVAVLDISDAALSRAKQRLGERAGDVQWIVGDVTNVENLGRFDVWHDRAVFHFLTEQKDRQRYAQLAEQTIPSGGFAIISTFALNGPPSCSGLNICRYNARSLTDELGGGFTLIREMHETHATPSGKTQEFIYAMFRRM